MTAAKITNLEGSVVADRYRIGMCLKADENKSSYTCADLHDDQVSFAMKIINIPRTGSGDVWDLSRDLSLLCRLRHPHLAGITDFGLLEHSRALYFVEEWVPGRDLLRGTEKAGTTEILFLLAEMFRAVRFLHRRGMVHGGLKASNILCMSDGNAVPDFKMSDSGMASFQPALDLRAAEKNGMLPFCAPEVLLGSRPDIRSDMYSLGILAYLVLVRQLPFEDADPGFMMQKHLQGSADLRPLERLKNGKYFVRLLRMLLEKDASKRPDSLDKPIDLLREASEGEAFKRSHREVLEKRFSSTRIVGRDKELLHLRTCAQRVREGRRGWTVFLSGEAGSGKTRCLEELKLWGQLGGWRVIEGACNARGEGSYSPYRQILSRVQSERQEDIFHFGQALQNESPGVIQSSIDYAAGQFRDLLTRELVRHVSRRPTLLLLDDFHEADEATCMVLDYLSSDIRAHPVLLCVGFRCSEYHGSSLERVIQLSVRQKRGEILPLEALSEESVRNIVGLMSGAPALAESLGPWLYRHVGGNPFFLEEMLKHIFEQEILKYVSGQWVFDPEITNQPEAPDSVGKVVRQRLGQLPQKSRETANWLALIDRPVTARFLRKVAPLEFSEITDSLKNLVDRQMVRLESKDKEIVAEFRHALIAEVLRSRLSKKNRQRMHGRIAEALEEESGGPARLQELARHSMEGKLGEKAVRYALTLASRARMEFSHEVAVQCLEYVLRERTGLTQEELCRVSIQAADAMLPLGLPGRAIRRLKAELSGSRNIDRDLKGRMYMQLALSCQHQGNSAGQEDFCRKGLRLYRGLPLAQKNLTRAMLYAEFAMGAAVQSHPRRGLVFLEKAMRACPDSGSEVLSGRIQIIAASLYRVACSLYKALVASREATRILLRTDAHYLTCSAYSTLGFILMNMGRFAQALEKHRQAVRLSVKSRAIIPRVQALGNLSECLCRMGRTQEAWKALDEAVQASGESENPAIDHALNTIKTEILIAQNDYTGARGMLRGLDQGGGTDRATYAVGHACYLAASLHYILGNFETALANIRRLRKIETSEAPCYEHELAEALYAGILFERGNTSDALKRLYALDRTVMQKRWPYHQAFVKLHLAEILLKTEDFESAAPHVRNALRLARGMQSVHLEGHARLLSGILHRRRWQQSSRHDGSNARDGQGAETWRGLHPAIEELEGSVRLAELSGHKEIAWRAQAELSAAFGSLQEEDLRLRHARAAYECLCRLENLVPGEMLAAFNDAFDRGRTKIELARVMDAASRAAQRPDAFGTNETGLYQSRILYRVSAAVNTAGDLNPLLESILDQLIQALGMERALIYLKDETSGKWLPAKGRSSSGKSIRLEVGPDLLDEAGRRGNPVVSADVEKDSRFESDRWILAGKPGRLLCAPLKVSGKTIGLLYTDHSLPAGSLDESVINLFAAFCNLSAIAVRNALVQQKLVKEKVELEGYLHQNREAYAEIVGGSRAAEDLRDRIAIVAASPLDVLITGESGTGKELVAKAIHRTCRRRSGKFMAVDCGSLSENLVESELFGYRKGAFTGAGENRQGLLEAANGGVLFLDEISNLPLPQQSKLLRVLEEREIRRVGETVTRKIDIQIIAATNRALPAEIAGGRFREDLYYRLKKMEIHIPPLRGRLDDIPALVYFFLKQTAEDEKGKMKGISARALEMLQNYSYPGNVRELRNILSGAYYSSTGSVIDLKDLPAEVLGEPRSAVLSETDLAPRLYRDILDGKGTFQDRIKSPFLNHAFGVSVVQDVIRMALEDARGNYRDALERLRVPDKSYALTLQFLKRHGCYLDFRPFRRKKKRE